MTATYFFTAYPGPRRPPLRLHVRLRATAAGSPGASGTVADVVRSIDREGFEIGLHGSYNSALVRRAPRAREGRARAATGLHVTSTRQHFLHWDVRTTPRLHADAGFSVDSTLGFNRNIGLRAGTSLPFRWFDLEQDRDVRPRRAPDRRPATARCCAATRSSSGCDLGRTVMRAMLERIASVGGVATVVFHPNNLESPDYLALFEDVIAFGSGARRVVRVGRAARRLVSHSRAAKPSDHRDPTGPRSAHRRALGWIADLYGAVDAKYSSKAFVRHQFVDNPFGWSAHVFVLDDGRAVGHCGVDPVLARVAVTRRFVAGKIEAVVVDAEYRGRRPTTAATSRPRCSRASTPSGSSTGWTGSSASRRRTSHASTCAPAATRCRRTRLRTRSSRRPSTYAGHEPSARRRTAVGLLAAAQGIASRGSRIFAGANGFRLEEPVAADAQLAAASIDSDAWTVSGADAWDWFVGSGTLEVIELPGPNGFRALVRIPKTGASPAQIVAWSARRRGLRPALRLLDAAARLARERGAPTLRFQPWAGAGGNGSLARACALAGLVRRPEAPLVVYSNDPGFDRLRVTPFLLRHLLTSLPFCGCRASPSSSPASTTERRFPRPSRRSKARRSTSSSSSTTARTIPRRSRRSRRLADDGTHVVRRANGGLSAARMTGVEVDDRAVRLPARRRRRRRARRARGARRRTRCGARRRARLGRHRGLGRGRDGARGRAVARSVAADVSQRRAGRVAPPPQRARGGRRLEHGIGLRGLGPLARARRAWLFRRARTPADAALPAPLGPDARRLHARARSRSTRSCAAATRSSSPHAARTCDGRRAPLRTKIAFPLVEALPLDPFARHRIYLFLNRPRQIVSFRRLRRAAA